MHRAAGATASPTAAQTPSGVAVAPTTQPARAAAEAAAAEDQDHRALARTRPRRIVFWGKKKLGETPVTLERPRDSGPVDLVVRAEGYFPVHTRAYTFRNESSDVKMTKLDDRMTLFGAKHDANEPPPGVDPRRRHASIRYLCSSSCSRSVARITGGRSRCDGAATRRGAAPLRDARAADRATSRDDRSGRSRPRSRS